MQKKKKKPAHSFILHCLVLPSPCLGSRTFLNGNISTCYVILRSFITPYSSCKGSVVSRWAVTSCECHT